MMNDDYYDLKSIYVDAGCFVVGDKDFFIQHGADEKRIIGLKHAYIIKCKPGKHIVRYEMDESWNISPPDEDDDYWIPESETYNMNIPSGELWVVDACYVIRDDLWMEFIDKGYLDNDDEFHFTINTGGDGEFNIRLWVSN